MENIDLVSIVVPIYNVEEYLEQCLQSIINQTYSNLEIILVDDGSVDNSLSIIKKYAKIDNRIIYVSKENGGQASARNVGYTMAHGKWIWNVDADDTIDVYTIEMVVKTALLNDSDIVISSHKLVNNNGINRISPRFDGTITGEEASVLMFSHVIGGDPWTRLIKTDIIKQYDIRIDEDFSVIDDVILNYLVFMHSNRVTACDELGPTHFYRPKSTSSKSHTLMFRKKHHQGIIALANYGFISKRVEYAYYGYLFADFLTCISMRNWYLLKSLSLTNIGVLADYLQYVSSYSLLKKERSSKKIELLALGAKNSITRYISAFILRLYFESFKYRYSK